MRAFARARIAAAASVCLLAFPTLAVAKVHIAIDLDKQVMHVTTDDGQSFETKVSSGKPGYETPAGDFKVLWMDKEHHSDTYDDAYMPDAIFFAPGYAIHGFGKSPWGHKASHGCVRIPMSRAAQLFDLVKAQGADITVTGQSPVTLASIREKLKERDAAAAPAAIEPRYEDARGNPVAGQPYADEASAGYAAGAYAPGGYARNAYAQSGYPQGGYAQGYPDPRYAAPPTPAPARDGFFGSFY